ncbi:MAG: 5'-methylthioadenosine/S-adenosylhomocysteine nucleosidase [Acholeplasmataceae bacterium]|nr:5'-methylthioadenosine/S-adenosylhomocysteine nucleosidase [Acholeplasmataceae bacterium]
MILVVAAMAEEVKELIEHEIPGVKVILTGIGKVNAAYTLASFLATHEVEAIYNLGFAGATTPYQVGDVVLVKEALYHDFDLTLFGYKKGQVPGLPERFQSNHNLVTKVLEKMPLIKSGVLYTGDVFMTEKKMESFIVDMEGTALYHVAYKKEVPIVSIKVVSDVLGMDNHFDSYKKFEASEGAKTLSEIYQKLFRGK